MVRDKTFLVELAVRYGGSLDKLIPITEGFQNEIYQLSKNHKDFVIRITSGKKKSLQQIRGELFFVQFLKRSGISVSEPVPSVNGNLIEVYHNNDESLYSAAFKKAEGAPIQVTDPFQWNSQLFHDWGRLLGQVHNNGKHYIVNEEQLKRPQWSIEKPCSHELFMNLSTTLEQEKYESIVTMLKKFPMDENHFGLIHNDFHQGNFFVKDGKITLFDFDDCCYFFYAYDIATAFYHAYWQHTSFNGPDHEFDQKFFVPFLKGYSNENALTDEIIIQIPLFLKLRELFLYLLFQKVWNVENPEDWQEYTLNNLRLNIENDANYAGLDEVKLNEIKSEIGI